MKLALFDLDHTLLPIDSDYSWGQFTVEIGWRDPETHTRANDAFYEQYKAGTLDIHEYTRFSVAPLIEHGVEKSDAAHRRFMDQVIRPAIRPVALELVRRHQAAGDQVLIVTATNEFRHPPHRGRLRRLRADRHRSGAQRAGQPDRCHPGHAFVPRRQGRACGTMAGFARPVLGRRGPQQLLQRFHQRSPAAGESRTEPVATNPDPRLSAIASERGWRILNLFE